MMCPSRGVWYTENAASYNSHGRGPGTWQPPSYPKAGVTSSINWKLCLFSVSRCEGVGSCKHLATLEEAFTLLVYKSHFLRSCGWACCVQWRCCASCGQSLREVLRVSQFSSVIFSRLFILTCSAITHTRFVNSYGLNHPKAGRRQRSFTCGSSSSVPDCLPDALI